MSERRPAPPRTPSIYRLTWWIAWAALRLFYRRIDGVGREHADRPGPLVLAANHPNYIIDALAIAVQTRRQIHFVAKGPLVERYPVLSPYLQKLGVVPIYRRSDDPKRRHSNRWSYEHCAELLAAGGAICMFAEGESHAERQVRELRSGTARIVLEAEASRSYRLGLRLVPVGLYFPEEDRYFTDGVVVFGAPIPLDAFCARHRTDPGGAVRALTGEIQRQLRDLTLHVPDLAWAACVEQISDLVRWGADDSALSQLRLTQEISQAAEIYRTERPAEASAFRAAVDDLWRRSEAWRRHRLPETDPIARRRGVLRRARDGAALPFAALGFAYHFAPYLIPRTWAQVFVQRREKKAFVKFLVGAPVLLAWYGAALRALWRRDPVVALSWIVIGPASGLLALRMRAHRRRWLDAWRRPDPVADAQLGSAIAAERAAVLEHFERWRREARRRDMDRRTPVGPS